MASVLRHAPSRRCRHHCVVLAVRLDLREKPLGRFVRAPVDRSLHRPGDSLAAPTATARPDKLMPMSRTPERDVPPEDPPGLPDALPGVDVTLIDAMLALSPEERLRENDRMVRTIEELRHGFAAARARDLAGTAGGQRD